MWAGADLPLRYATGHKLLIRPYTPPPIIKQNNSVFSELFLCVGRGGFEPPKAEPADLQSAPFDHSGTDPFYKETRANRGIRTHDLWFTKPLLYQLSYVGALTNLKVLEHKNNSLLSTASQEKKESNKSIPRNLH